MPANDVTQPLRADSMRRGLIPSRGSREFWQIPLPTTAISVVLSCWWLFCPPLPPLARADAPQQAEVRAFVQQYCLDCHATEEAKGGVRLDNMPADWTQSRTVDAWERVYDVLRHHEMPPSDAEQPDDAARHRMVAWLFQQLSQYATVGGTVPRRLNRDEYENTIRDLFGLEEFQIPDAFPADDVTHGFDNVAEGLVLSPPLMNQYLELATQVADQVLPPDRGPRIAEPKQLDVKATDLIQQRGAGAATVDKRFRLVSSKNMANSAAWPSLFEAHQSGVYRLKVRVSLFETDQMFYERRTSPIHLGVYAREKTDQVYAPFNEVRRLTQWEVPSSGSQPRELTTEIELHRGQIFGLRWENGPCYSDTHRREYAKAFYDDRLRRNRRHYAAMLQLGKGHRGMSQADYYQATVDLINSNDLDLSDPRLDVLPKTYGGGLADTPHRWISRYVHEELFRFGPALDVLSIHIEGPLRLVDDDHRRAQLARTAKFLGGSPIDGLDETHVRTVLKRFLPRAFRRSVSPEQLRPYVQLAMDHINDTPSARVEDGLHLAVRRALVSPHFLYRCLSPGRLDSFDLASRLSYFLTSAPPDESLRRLAASGTLANPGTLRRETLRLLADSRHERFVQRFTGQWLGTRLLQDIMPDPRLLKFFEADRKALIDETEMFVGEILRENHPLETFVDPDFAYRSTRLAKIYGGTWTNTELTRVALEPGNRHGGILGLASVMMATANGVDTHPVHRGVWILENVLGTPTPAPPPNVPAIAPNTTGTSTIEEQLAAHRADDSCARCHSKIDPLGIVLENFDPVGRWREFYPRYIKPEDGIDPLKEEFYSTVGEGTQKGPPVSAVGVLEGGRTLRDVGDLKHYVFENSHLFARCLTEKLLVYATGRPQKFADQRVIDLIVRRTKEKGNGFRDLVEAVVESESFLTK